MPKFTFAAAFAAIVFLAAAFRLPDLAAKPMHGDEANQAVKAAHLLEAGEYAYDPFEHHGPTLYYLTQPIFWLTGTHTLAASQEWQYRLLPALFGVLVVALLWGLRDALGRAGTLWAALLTAVSHAMVYYSRYYVQEMLFVCFALAAIVAGWRYLKSPSIANALLLGASLGLIQATKETAILLYAAAAVALIAVYLWQRVSSGAWPVFRAHLRPACIAACAAAVLAVCLMFYSSFGTHPRGILDALLTYSRYFARAEGAGSAGPHDKPFLYYLEILAYCYREPGPRWTEGFALVAAIVGAFVALLAKSRPAPGDYAHPGAPHFRRFIAIYAAVLTILFSAVPYKTPWNLLPFWQPLLILSGLGIGWLTTSRGNAALRAVMCLACSVAAAHAGRQAYLGAFVYPADTRNPYVYAHTTTALARVLERIDQIAAVHPAGKKLVIGVIGDGGDYWPLPWYLRNYPNVGYWSQVPDKLDVDVLLASARFGPDLMGKMGETYHVETGALRPSAILAVFVKNAWWERFMAGRG